MRCSKYLPVANGVPVDRVLDECLLVGYERFSAVLEGGMAAWRTAGSAQIGSGLVGVMEARRSLLAGATPLDVREPNVLSEGHIPGAIRIPLGELPRRVHEVSVGRPIVAYCGHGERAASAVSLLERAGHELLFNINGGVEAWQDAGLAVAR